MHAMPGAHQEAARGASRTSGDSLPAPRSPSTWWKWLQNRMLVVVRPTRTDAAAASSERDAGGAVPLTAPTYNRKQGQQGLP